MASSVLVLNSCITLLLVCCSLHKGVCISSAQQSCTTINQTSLLEYPHQTVSQAVSDRIIFMPFHQITCEGRISMWQVQINGKGTHSVDISFTVWKPSNTSTSEYSLVGMNSLHVTEVYNATTLQLEPELEDQIDVEPGFVIGLHVGNTEGSSSAVSTVRVEASDQQYITYYINYAATLGVSTLLDYNTASLFKVNEIPLVSAKIVDKYVVSTTTPSDRTTAAIPDLHSMSNIIPTPTGQPKATRKLESSQQVTLSRSNDSPHSTVVSSTANPMPPKNGSSIMITSIVAIVLVLVIIISTLTFVVMVCYTIRRRHTNKSTINNPTYEEKRKSTLKQYAFPVTRNPSYSGRNSLSLDYCKMKRANVISEHVYESCYDPYEYLEPVSLADKTVNSLPVKTSRLTKQSAIYEIPFAFTLNEIKKSPSLGVNNLYLTASALMQPPPVSPGYEVPVCPNVPSNAKDSLEESARYKEPGWVCNSLN